MLRWTCTGGLVITGAELPKNGYVYLAGENSTIIMGTVGRKGGSRGGLMVSALDSGLSGLGLSPGLGHCVVFLGKTLNSHNGSLHPGV